MAQALRASRQSADDVAAGFYVFRDPLPEHVGDITSLMSELYAISSSLSTLERLAEDPRKRRYFELIKPDLNVVQASFAYTIEDIGDIFRGLDGPDASPARYKRTWVILSRFFWDQSNYTLATRLAKYKTVFKEFNDLLKNDHYTSSLLVGLVNGFKVLLSIQDSRFAARFDGMTLRPDDSPPGYRASTPSPRERPVSDRNTRRRRSYERTRPPHLSPPPMSPSSATSSDFPPSVPDIPLSPLTSTSATTTTSHSTSPDIIKEHWAKDTFGSSSTSTPLPSVRERSHCRGEPYPGIKQSIKDKGFEELLQLQSLNDETDMRVSFYLRRSDHRVRILCKEPHRTGPSDYYCLPLNLLEILRDGSCLRLCRRRNRGTELVLWTQLKFTTLEDLVLFHNTFLALRSQDAGHPIGEILDHELAHERERFGATIREDGYTHALRIYKDRLTGAIRLQSSVHDGEMKHTPVWTAFVTHNLGKRSWLKSYDSRTVIVRDIKPVIFMSMDDYNPPQTSQGHHVLEFEKPRGKWLDWNQISSYC
ncbi:Pc13g09010 [Penicillium rubens Wisconsin 54-1255]|uniref:Pc13g09010 protein n=1 Tax=Penicillium rubens (strain ATCC 28089 / DSM 1075 / NRRL 1951 / Wisconsin 54-1255) TaxID=500485 RepID=B6H4J1_PENRW|nr:Pc13g09010 [Penicillium rubens Wisconsin 54-1255]